MASRLLRFVFVLLESHGGVEEDGPGDERKYRTISPLVYVMERSPSIRRCVSRLAALVYVKDHPLDER